MGMKHWWWRTTVSHCSNIMASLFIHEMAAIIWDSCDDFYHCNGFFNCPCNSCHQKIIFQNKEKHLKRERIFTFMSHRANCIEFVQHHFQQTLIPDSLYREDQTILQSSLLLSLAFKVAIVDPHLLLILDIENYHWTSNIEYYYWTLKYVVHPSSISQNVGKVLMAGGYWPLSTCLIFLLNGIGTHEHALKRNTHDIISLTCVSCRHIQQ